jgi:hypothetical protein
MHTRSPNFCVFCGRRPPAEKNKEHVIPQWLIKHTGDPNRQINLGSLYGRHEAETPKTFAFDQLRFPACRRCNTEYGAKLEDVAKPVMLKLLDAEAVSASDIDVLLDWLDKVRIGLWLGHYHYLSGSPFSTDPPFSYIAPQIGAADRMLCIYEYDTKRSGITFMGIETLAFAHQPYCFTLAVNHLAFFSVAFPFLCSRSMGLPYAGVLYVESPNKVNADIYPGSESLEPSAATVGGVVDFSFDQRSSNFFQAVRPAGISEAYLSWYENDHAQELISPSTGKGLVFSLKDEQLSLYPSDPSRSWKPALQYDPLSLNCLLATQTLWVQDYTLDRVSYERLDPVSQTDAEHRRDMAHDSNRKMMTQVEEDCKKGRFEPALRAFDIE